MVIMAVDQTDMPKSLPASRNISNLPTYDDTVLHYVFKRI